MQLAEELEYAKRGLYSWARVYANQIGSGEQYNKNLHKTIAIHILNFTFINYKKTDGWIKLIPQKYHHRFVLSDKETNIEVFKDLEIHIIELNKFDGIKDDDLNLIMPKVKDMLDSWVVVLTKYNLLDIKNLPEKINTPEIKKSLVY
jgi:predicted transposase/invertase (TIGR01784 family)